MPQLYHGFRKVYEFLVENGVAPSDIGVYGSLLAGIIGRNPKDIDIVLRGLRNQPIIRELAHKLHPKPTTFQFQNISNTALLAEQARIKNGSIVIPNGAGVYCDVKVVPNYDEGNANRVFCSDSLTFGDTIEFEGDIIEDRESLSYPGSYVIHTYHGPILVVSNCYEHIGSACEGDRVKCRGVEFTTDSGEKGIMLTKTQYEPDGDTHFIVI